VSSDPVIQLADWEGVREALAEIRAGREDFGRFFAEMFGEMEAMLADARNELIQAREEFRRQREEFEAARAKPTRTEPDNDLSGELSHAEQECRALREERAVLESELETVRARAAEMTESLDEQKKRTAQQQARWEDEFHWQRRLLEEVAGRLSDHALGAGDMPLQSQQEAGPPESVKLHTLPQPRPAETPTETDDGVLDSVLAQFQMLQKDVARRRRKSQAG
jgi:DNA repair exonuclease SbcCD ATPase subunit